MALTPNEELGIKKVLALEAAKRALLKKQDERSVAMKAAQQQVENQYNQDVANLEQAVKDAETDLGNTAIGV